VRMVQFSQHQLFNKCCGEGQRCSSKC
jgi:hypothetical protein